MNAPARIDTPIPATREHELAVLVERILADDYSGIPKVEWEYYGKPDWRDAAEYAADSQDFSDIEHMLTKESMWQGWMRLSDREQEAWADDFENYFSARNADRVVSPVDASNVRLFPNIALAADHLASLSDGERERLNREWAA